MAKITIENIARINLSVVPEERKFGTSGELAVNPLVRMMYIDKGYDDKPKSKEERNARGLRGGWNGLMSSFPKIEANYENGENVVNATIAPTRYLVGQAMRDLMDTAGSVFTQKEIQEMSPDMAGVSLVVPVKLEGEYFLMSQIKGDALGSGQISAGLVAGRIDAKYLNHSDPLAATLHNECSEEVGMDLSCLDPTSVIYMVDERETGQVNFAYVARNADAESILHAYEASVKGKIPAGKKLEVSGLANLPVSGIALTALEGNTVRDITCFIPTEHGLEREVQDRQVRPYTQAVLDYLYKPENLKFLLEKAGF